MKLSLVIIGMLLTFTPSSCQQCSDKCWFVYEPSDSRSSYQDFIVPVPPDRKITGIITIDGEFRQSSSSVPLRDTLRFSRTDYLENYADPLVLAIDVFAIEDKNQLVAWGEATFPGLGKDIHGAQFFDRPPYKFKIFPNTSINIQLSDINITTDKYYQFYVGEPGNSEHWEYNYESEEMWQRFSDKRLNTTAKIKDRDPDNLTRYNFISVCDGPRPVLCDAEHDVLVNAALGAGYTLSCSGSGAPYLSSEWDSNTYRPTNEVHEEVIVNTTADNFIRSTLKIDSFTVDHIGTWTCTILNLNFQEIIRKTYLFEYTEPASLMNRPSLDIYDPSTGNTSLVWKVEGWPLQQIHLECDFGVGGTHEIRRNDKQFYNKVPPRLTITMVLTTATIQGLISCKLLNVNEVMDNMTITKVGYKCKSGQYGKGRFCLDCPRGETSSSGSTECFPVSNSCPQDQFGVGEDCRICPRGTVTFPTDMAAKEQDCRDVTSLSHCSPGEYGYGGTNECLVCPPAMTSLRGAVKAYDCTYLKSFCGIPGYWGEKDNCISCPGNYTSGTKAVKIQDCYPIKSACLPGYFGIDTDCAACPEGMTSHSQTIVVEGCFKEQKLTSDKSSSEKTDFYAIGFCVTTGIVIVIIACLIIYCYKQNILDCLSTTPNSSSSYATIDDANVPLRSMVELRNLNNESPLPQAGNVPDPTNSSELEVEPEATEVLPVQSCVSNSSPETSPEADQGAESGIVFFTERLSISNNRTDRRSPRTV